ncbi:TlpA disulfide reductase family protein [Solirubrum puertoriconensis]|uniref:Thioredoxin domain-containing protein n=1 Tax=Solirubrum puertoriconensis TaxID=1751427 RepID=A0A9X0HMD2_SOLP1|nr:TlpA disulfide reductase family protein [Solirubrum puertoriconensis]KUG08516.1 hypothetical protein ASU33_10160 [Solirubrum puertoriconensis]
MKHLRILVLMLLCLGAAPAWAQKVSVVKLPALQRVLARPTDTTYVINFWATWCKPCIEELPHFEKVRARYANQKVRVLLVSLDFPSKLEQKVKPFVKQQRLASTVWLLNETDANAYIDKVDPKWSGALPFTLLINNRRKLRTSFEQPLTEAELTQALRPFVRP